MLLLATLSAALASDPGPCGGLHPDRETPLVLLEGRLQMRVPASVDLLPNPPSVTGAPFAPSERTTAVLDKDAAELGFTAEELYRRAEVDSQVAAWLQAPGFVGAPADARGPAEVHADPRLQVFARELGGATLPGGTERLLLVAAVRTPEGTWVRLQARVPGRNAAEAAACGAVLFDALETLQPGPAGIDLRPHPWGVDLGHRTVAFTLGEQMVARVQRATDHLIVRVTPIAGATDPDAELRVRLADTAPSPDPGRKVFQRSRWMDQRGSWYAGEPCPGGDEPCALERTAQVQPDGTEGWPRLAYATVQAGDPATRDALLAVAASMRWFNPDAEPVHRVKMTTVPGGI